MSDEAVVRMGLDTGPLATGLRGAERMVEQSGERIKDQFKDLSSEIAGAFTLTAAIGVIEKTFQKVQQITRAAESTGVSTDFIQTIENAGAASGIAGEQMEKMLDKFAATLPAGADVETEFYAIADAIAAVDDPATRAQMATDAFGKSGVKMIAVLKDGKAGIQDLAGGFGKLSEAEMKSIEEAHLNIEKLESRVTIGVGTLLGFIHDIGTMAGSIWEGRSAREGIEDEQGERNQAEAAKEKAKEAAKVLRVAEAERKVKEETTAAVEKYNKHLQDIQLKSKETSYEDKKAILEKRYAEEASAVKAANNDIARVDHMTKMADLKQEILDLEKRHNDELDKKAHKDKEDLDRQQKKVDAAVDAVARAEHSLGEARKSPYEFSLEELAKSNGFESGDARDVEQLRDWAKWNFMHGNFDLGNNQKNRAENIFDQMAKDNPYLKNPYEKIEDQLKEANKKLAGVLTVTGGPD